MNIGGNYPNQQPMPQQVPQQQQLAQNQQLLQLQQHERQQLEQFQQHQLQQLPQGDPQYQQLLHRHHLHRQHLQQQHIQEQLNQQRPNQQIPQQQQIAQNQQPLHQFHQQHQQLHQQEAQNQQIQLQLQQLQQQHQQNLQQGQHHHQILPGIQQIQQLQQQQQENLQQLQRQQHQLQLQPIALPNIQRQQPNRQQNQQPQFQQQQQQQNQQPQQLPNIVHPLLPQQNKILPTIQNQKTEKFICLKDFEDINMNVEENTITFHTVLFQISLGEKLDSTDSDMEELALFIKSNPKLLNVFKNSIQSEPVIDLLDFIRKLSRRILTNDLPIWVKDTEIIDCDQNMNIDLKKNPKSNFELEKELIQQCISDKYSINYEDLKRLKIANWMSLKDKQGRSPIHIILSHGPLNDQRSNAIGQLLKICPALLSISDSNEYTPIDILFKNEDMQLASKLFNTAYPPSITSFYARLSCQCHAKEAESISKEYPINFQELITPELVDLIPKEHNPIYVCNKLGKKNLAEYLLNSFQYVNMNSNVDTNFEKLVKAIIWRSPDLILSYSKECDVLSFDSLLPFMSRLVEMHCESLVEEIATCIANYDQYNGDFLTKKFIVLFDYAPQLLLKQGFELCTDANIINFITCSLRIVTEHNGMSDDQLDVILELLRKSLNSTSSVIKGDLARSIFLLMPKIFLKKRRELAEGLIKTYAKQESAKYLFSDICGGCFALKMDLQFIDDYFEWIVPVLKKEVVPIQIKTGDKSLLLESIAKYDEPQISLNFFNQLKNIISKEQMVELLNFRNSDNLSPLECLCDFKNNFDEKKLKAQCLLIKEFIKNGSRIESIESTLLKRNLVFKIILFGDQELENLCNLDNIDAKSLVNEFECKNTINYNNNTMKCTSPEKIKFFFKFINSLPKETQKFLFDSSFFGPQNKQIFPFEYSLLCSNLLKNDDKELLDNFISIISNLTDSQISYLHYNLVTELFSEDCKYHPKSLERCLSHEIWNTKNNATVVQRLFNNGLATDLEFEFLNDNPYILELLLNRYMNGTIDVKKIPIKNVKLLDSIIKYSKNKIKSHVKYSVLENKLYCMSIYSPYTTKLIVQGVYTEKAVNTIIEEDRKKSNIDQQILNLKKPQKLKSFLSKFDHLILEDNKIIDRNFFFNKIDQSSPLWIINCPEENRIKINYVNFNSGTIDIKTFSYQQENVIDEITKFIDSTLAEFASRKKLLLESLPEFCCFTEFNQRNDDPRMTSSIHIHPTGLNTMISHKSHKYSITPSIILQNIPGIISVETLNSCLELGNDRIECLKDAATNGFETTVISQPNLTFSLILESIANYLKSDEDSKMFAEIDNGLDFPLKLFCYPKIDSPAFFMVSCGLRREISPFIIEMDRIIEAAQGYAINYETAKNFEFNEMKSMIHEKAANIDLDILNKEFVSYEKSTYLKDFIKFKQKSFDSLKSNLENLISFAKNGQCIKDLNIEDSKRLTIQLSHTLKHFKESNTNELCRFVCELAFESTYCGPQIADKINFEYCNAFDLIHIDESLKGENTESIFMGVYAQAIYETVETMLKFAISPENRQQTIHVKGYLLNCLKEHINLPQGPLNNSVKDVFINSYGAGDFPVQEIKQVFEAFFIPIMIQMLTRKGTRLTQYDKESWDILDRLQDGFFEALFSSDCLLLDSDAQTAFSRLETEKEATISDFNNQLAIANDKYNHYLTDTLYTQQKSIEQKCHEVEQKINAIALDYLNLSYELGEIDRALNPSSDKHSALKNEKRKYEQMTSLYQEIGSNEIFMIQKERIEEEIKNLNIIDFKLKKDREFLQKSIEKFKESPLSKVAEIKNEIKKIECKKIDLLKHFNRKKIEMIQEFCVESGWLILDEEYETYNLTEAGSAKYLELKKILQIENECGNFEY